jgi:hypothetical protein
MFFFDDGERFLDFRRTIKPAPNGFQRHPSGIDRGHFNVVG